MLFFAPAALFAQNDIQYLGKQFFAVTVAHADSSSKWYEDVFRMKLIKEYKSPDGKIHVRILGNGYLKVELVQNENSYPECSVLKDGKYKVRNCFKAGVYVVNIKSAEAYCRKKNVNIKYGPFDDNETNSKSFIIEDTNGLLIQVLQELQ
jgi:hypothetical protein